MLFMWFHRCVGYARPFFLSFIPHCPYVGEGAAESKTVAHSPALPITSKLNAPLGDSEGEPLRPLLGSVLWQQPHQWSLGATSNGWLLLCVVYPKAQWLATGETLPGQGVSTKVSVTQCPRLFSAGTRNKHAETGVHFASVLTCVVFALG